MIIVEDTRNQINKHKNIHEQLDQTQIPLVRSKLFVGDYSRLDNMTVCIDTKKDYLELAGNLCGKQHARFREECIRAKLGHIRLIVLVEENLPAEQWKSPKTRRGVPISNVDGVVLGKVMKTMTEKYGVEFAYCDKSETANKIIEILGGTEK